MDDSVELGEDLPKRPVKAACARLAGCHLGRRGMVDEVVGKEFVEDMEIAVVSQFEICFFGSSLIP
jgi:hypothetical protein